MEDVATGLAYFCACSAWLGQREGGGLCERTLPASASDPRPPKKTYQVRRMVPGGHSWCLCLQCPQAGWLAGWLAALIPLVLG